MASLLFTNGNRLNNPSSIVAVDAMYDVGMHDPTYVQGQDFDWWIRYTKKYSFGIIEEPLVHVRRFLETEDRANTSAKSELCDARFYNEYMQMRYEYFDHMENELFKRCFQKDFRNPDSNTPEELECEKAFLMMQNFGCSQSDAALGGLKIQALLRQDSYRELLEQKYNFTIKDYYMWNGKHLYYDLTTHQKCVAYEHQKMLIERQRASLEQLQIQLTAANDTVDHLRQLLYAEQQKNQVLKTAYQKIKKLLKGNLHDS